MVEIETKYLVSIFGFPRDHFRMKAYSIPYIMAILQNRRGIDFGYLAIVLVMSILELCQGYFRTFLYFVKTGSQK